MDEWIIKYYSMGLYTVDDLKVFVQVQWITAEQYKETTGIDYVAS